MLIMGDSAENILFSRGGGSPGGHLSGLDPLVITVYGNTASGEDKYRRQKENGGTFVCLECFTSR